MCDGSIDLAYAIESVIDIVPIKIDLQRAMTPGLVSGVMLIDERPIEFLDAFWVFAQASNNEPAVEDRPLCLLNEDTPWMRQVLAPLVESAGYAVAFPGDALTGPPHITILSEEAEPVAAEGHILRLRMASEERGEEDRSLWRYDRTALTAELQRHWKRSA
jgi:two-component system chemotaxis sensor kinase CheA